MKAVSYCEPETDLSTWKSLATATKLASHINTYTGAKYVIYREETLQEIIVSFRGTVDIRNWIVDVAFVKIGKRGAISVHGGFKVAYHSVRKRLLNDLMDAFEGYEKFGLTFVGHSMGAALATLAVYDTITTPKKHRDRSLSSLGIRSNEISLITFASPRVGNAEFASAFNSHTYKRMYRVTNMNDLVVHLPPQSLGWMHVERELWMGIDGVLVQCGDDGNGESNECANSFAGGFSTAAHSNGYLGNSIGPMACQLAYFQGFEK